MDNNYSISNIIIWSTLGYIVGQYITYIIFNLNNNIANKIVICYGIIRLIEDSIREYNSKPLLEFFIKN